MEMQAPAQVEDEVRRLRERVALLESRVVDLESLSPDRARKNRHNARTRIEMIQATDNFAPDDSNLGEADAETRSTNAWQEPPTRQQTEEVKKNHKGPDKTTNDSSEYNGFWLPPNQGDDKAATAGEQPHSASSDSPGSLEARIGLYWLSRLGIGFLVVGIALLISYSFQYFGPVAKLATGFLSSIGLILFAEFLERKKSIIGFSRVLAGGGWSLAFFTTFAMHHIQSVRVVENPLVAFAFMSMTVIAAVSHAVAKRSELMAVLAIILGFVTVFLAPTGLFSAAASALLAGATAYLTVRMKWFGLNIAGLLGAYTCYALVTDNAGTATSNAMQQFWLSSAYLLPTWFCNMWTTLNLREDKKAERAAGLTTAAINSSAFLWLWLPALDSAFGAAGACAYPAIGALNLACGRLADSRSQKALSILYSMVGLTLLTMYVPKLLNHDWSTFAIAVESLTLTALGLRYNLRSFRWFGMLLSLSSLLTTIVDLAHTEASNAFLMFCQLSLVASWVASAYLYTVKQFVEKVSVVERAIAFHFYTTIGAILALFAPVNWILRELSDEYQRAALGIAWSLEALLWTVFATKTRRMYPAFLSCFASLCAAIATLIVGNPLSLAVCSAVMYLPVMEYRSKANRDVPWAKNFSYAQLSLASCGTSAFIANQGPAEYAALFVTFHAFIIFLIGIVKKERGLRMCAMPFFLLGWMFQYAWAASASKVPLAAILYTAGLFYAKGTTFGGERALRHVFNLMATYVLAVFAAQEFENGWISCAWAIQGAALLGVGFRLKDKWLRVMGLGMFALLVGKLLLVDLAAAQAIHRILAFIVAGLALLGSSFAYTWFARKLEQSAPGT